MRLLNLALIFVTLCNCYSKNYDNYTLYQGTADTQEKMAFFDKIDDLLDVNYWTRPGLVNMSVQFTVAPVNKMDLLALAAEYHVPLTVQINNIQRVFDKQVVKEYERSRTTSFNWKSYFRVDDIYNWLKDLSKQYPNRLKIYSIGKSHECRQIMVARIILKNPKPSLKKCLSLCGMTEKEFPLKTTKITRNDVFWITKMECKLLDFYDKCLLPEIIDARKSRSMSFRDVRSRIIIEGGIHAREWLAISFVTYLLQQILTAPSSKDKNLKKLALKYEWYFVPILNPDGYEYSHREDRMYRTNKRNVDLNRNFDYKFGTVGVSHNKKKSTYCGPYAFSEPETKSMRDFVKSKRHNLKYYIGFHSYGQYIIIPYANTKKLLDNYSEVKIMGNKAAKQIEKQYGTEYRVGNTFATIGYLVSGDSAAWVKKSFQVPYVLTFELRDKGKYGFAIPPKYIIPTCYETMAGIVTLLLAGNDSTPSQKTLNVETNGYDYNTSLIIHFYFVFFATIY